VVVSIVGTGVLGLPYAFRTAGWVAGCASSSPPPDAAVDWRGRPCEPRRHGGMRAAVFVLGECSCA
jgi:hypothetical protein